MTFAEMYVKWSVILTDRFGPEILAMLEKKGQVLHRVRVRLKVPGWLSDLNALLTRKFVVVENDIFDCKILRLVGEDEWNSVGSSFCRLCSAVSQSISWARHGAQEIDTSPQMSSIA